MTPLDFVWQLALGAAARYVPFVDLLEWMAMVRKGRCQNRRLVVLKQNHIFCRMCRRWKQQRGIQGVIGAIGPWKRRKYFFHHNFKHFRKDHWRFKAVFSIDVLSQQFCGGYFISLIRVKLLWDRLNYQILLRSPSLTLLAGSAPGEQRVNVQDPSWLCLVGETFLILRD